MKLQKLFLVLLIASCAPTIKNFEKYQKQFLSKTNFMPSVESLEGKNPKVAVFALDTNNNQVAKDADIGNSLANNIETILSQNRLAELVDRNAGAKLQQEIALAEMNKTGVYKGPQVADYAISGSVSNAGFTKKYSEGQTYFNPKNGAMVTVPPKYVYSSEVVGNIKIYELPSLAVADTIEFSGIKSRTENTQQNGGVRFGGLQIGGEQVGGANRDDALVRKAAEDAIDNAKVDIKNFFAKKGYILEKRVFDNKSIFKINLGSSDGIKHGDELEITGQYEVENPITNKVEVERRVIGKAIVADKIDPKTCWVVLDDDSYVNSVRLGDAVKMKYKKSSFDKFAKAAVSVMEQQ